MPVSLDPIWFSCCRRHGQKGPLPREGWAGLPSLQWLQQPCDLVLRARCLPGGAARSPALPRVGARSRTAHSHLRVQARRAGRHCIYRRRRCQEARRPGGGQGRADWRELAATGCSLRGGRRPSLGMQSEGPPALAAPGPVTVTVGTRDPRKTPRGVGAAIGGSPPGRPSGAAPAEIPQREGSAFPSGLASRVRGGGVRKGSGFPHPRGRRGGSPSSRRCALHHRAAWGGSAQCRQAVPLGHGSKSSLRAPRRTGYGGASSQRR